MTDSCIICETEPIDDADWYRCEKTMEVVCPWCVEDMHKAREKTTSSPPSVNEKDSKP